MASTFTSRLRLEKMGAGDQDGTWGNTANSNLEMLEQAVAGLTSVVMANANKTLTAFNNVADESRSAILVVTSSVALTAVRDIIVPGASKMWAVRNNTTGGYAVRVKTAAGAGVLVPNGSSRLVYCDGADCALAVDFSADGVKPGTVQSTSRVASAPDDGYLWCDGAAYSRTVYQALFEAITARPTANIASGSATLTAVSSLDGVWVGSPISGTGIPVGATVVSVGAGTITISANATASGTAVQVCVAPYGVGDGTTTFNVPDYQGRSPFGVDPAQARMATATVGFDVTRLGAVGGSQHMHGHSHGVTDPGHAHGYTDPKHSHGVSDPGHGHSAWTDSQGAHAHQFARFEPVGGSVPGLAGSNLWSEIGGRWTDTQGAHGHNVGIGSAATGISLATASVGITISSAATGLSVQSAGSGNSQNIPPAIMTRWQIKY